MKKIGFYFSELLITTLIYVVILWYFVSQGYIFSPYNREISWIIVVLFGVGILMVTQHLRKLHKEDRQLTLFFEQLENFRIATSQLLENRQTLSPEMATNRLRKTIDEYFTLLEPSLFREHVYKIFNTVLASNKPNLDSLSTLLQQKIERRGTRIRYIAGILVMIGLLGTFLGLVQAIKYLQHFFTATESADLTTLFSDMKQTLGGLDKAFGTSIGGITAYIVLSYQSLVLRSKQSYILTHIEEATSEHLIPIMRQFYAGEPQAALATDQMLRKIPETIADQLGLALEKVVRQTIGGSTEDLKSTSTHLQQATEGLQEGQQVFTDTLKAFGDFLTTFQDGREQLLESQKAMASGIQEFSRELSILKDNQQMLASSLNLTKEYMTNSETHFSSMDDVVGKMHDIWADNRQTFGQLVETIQQEHAALAKIAQSLEEFLQGAKTEASTYFQDAKEGIQTAVGENTEINQKLLESHTLLTTLMHNIKNFILDEQQGLQLLSNTLQDTFEETRFQYLHVTEHIEELHKRLLESQEQLAQLQEATAAIQQQTQPRR